MDSSIPLELKKKINIHAFDHVTKNWLRAKVIDLDGNKAKVTWAIYDRTYDCWIEQNDIRLPITTRSLVKRNAINKNEFPLRKEPKFIQGGDAIYDKGRNLEFVVEMNDKFKAEVTTTCGKKVLYEYLKESEGRESSEDDDVIENIEDVVVEADEDILPSLDDEFPVMSPLPPLLDESTNETSINETLKVILDHVKSMQAEMTLLKAQNNALSEKLEIVVKTVQKKKRKIDSKRKSKKKSKRKSKEKLKETLTQLNYTRSPLKENPFTPPPPHYTPAATNSFISVSPSPSSLNLVPEFQTTFMPSFETTPNKIIAGSYMDLLTSNEMPIIEPTPKKQRKTNKAVSLIKTELGIKFTEDELANSNVKGGERKFKEMMCNKKSLSPGRLNAIATKARRLHKEEFEKIKNFNEVVNSKCRSVNLKLKKKST